jgi:hypothetical protein
MRQVFLLLLAMFFLSSCAYVNSISLTPIPANRKSVVKSEKSKTIFLGFNFDNDFIDEVVDDLIRQCPNGKVTGILTKDVNVDYFLYIVWKKQITATGYCIPSTSAKKKSKNASREAASEDLDDTTESQL